jgi:hypothetical protein
MFENADLIHRYTRAQAIADGVLIDGSQTAREAGFGFPVALTRAVWERCVAVPPAVVCQDEAGRLWDVLWLLPLPDEPVESTVRSHQFGFAGRCPAALGRCSS